MNPCIIIFNRAKERYEAYNEDGRLMVVGTDYKDTDYRLFICGGETVSLNSRIGRTIFDHLPLNVQMQQTTKS